jgi:hypothetical protein
VRVADAGVAGAAAEWERGAHGISSVVSSIEHDGVERVLAVAGAVGEYLRGSQL